MLDKLLGDVSRERFKRAVMVCAAASAILVLGLSLGDNFLAFVVGNGITSAIVLVILVAITLAVQRKGFEILLAERFPWGRIILSDIGAWLIAMVLSFLIGIILFWMPGGKIIIPLIQWVLFSLIAPLIIMRWPQADDLEAEEQEIRQVESYDSGDDDIELIS